MKVSVASALPMGGLAPGLQIENPTLELDSEGRYRLHFELAWDTWTRVDAAHDFHLEPAVRGPQLLGDFPDGSRIHIEAQASPAVQARLARLPDPNELVRALLGGDTSSPARQAHGWYALNVKHELSAGMFAGFATSWNERPLPVGGEGTFDERLARVIADGEGVAALLDEHWDGLPYDAQVSTGRGLVTRLGDAPDTSRDDVIAWLGRDASQRLPAIWPLLDTWPAWLGTRGAALVTAACGARGWEPEQRAVLECRVEETAAWGPFVSLLVNSDLREVPIVLAGAMRAGAFLDQDLYDELAAPVTTWQKDLLGPVCQGIACGGPVEKAKWRLSLAKRLKNDSPLWAIVGPALEDPLPVYVPDANPYK